MRSSETLPFKSSRRVANQIHVIQPYRHASTWVFDDPSVGLHKEPFVSGIPQMIDTLIANVPNAEKGFRLLFSAEPFPGYQIELIKGRAEYQGVWYRWAERKAEGWLCPALFRYFQTAPPRLYARAEPLG
jgi:hypothetical protein